jgi:PqqD family protein of HPr-rel-A system
LSRAESNAPVLWRASPVEDIAWIPFDDEYVAYHRPSGKTHFLNAATHRLLTDLLVEPASVATVAAAFAAVSSASPVGDLEKELRATLAHLESLGLVGRE